MTTIPFDPLLSALERKARALSPTEGYTFTAQRLLYAALDGVPRVENGEKAAQILEGYLRFRFEDVSLAKKVLGDLIGKKQATFFDDIYLKKRIWAASEASDGGKRDVLSAMDLFVAIMKDAPDWLAPLIRKDTAEEESLTEEPEESDEEETSSQEVEDGAKEEAAPAVGKTDFDVAMEELDKKKAEREGEIEVDDFLAKIDEALGTNLSDPADARRGMSLLVDEVRQVRGKLLESVFGQDNAIGVFSEGYFRAKMFSDSGEKRNRPLATYLFTGPPGVGKTFFAEVAAEAMGLPFKRFDMSGYADKEAIVDFLGLNQSYKAAKPGTVTGFVKENPKCLLLFDEVEKAHITIIYLFLQMLDAGRLHDNYHDEDVSFRDTIIILTTNAGRQLYEGSESTDLSHVSRKAIIDALKKDVDPQTKAPFFPEAICSRFSSGNVILFNHIGVADLCRVAKKEVGRHVATLKERYGIDVSVAQEVYSSLLYSVGSNADARTLRGRAESFFLNEVYELLRLISSADTEMGVKNIEEILIEPDLSGAAEDVVELFRPSAKMRLLVFGEETLDDGVTEMLSEFDLLETRDEKTAADALAEGVDLVLVNVAFREPSLSNLNLEDEPSPSRDFLRMLRKEYEDVPVYLLETRVGSITEEERLSFLRAGVRGVLAAGEDFGERMAQVSVALYQQASIKKLARASKVVTFDTAQSVSEDGTRAHIRLYDFRTERVVLSEDKDSVQSALSMPKLRFSDVIGAEDAKKELRYFVEYLKNPKKYLGTGVKAPRGLLLYGPPGTGKTMLAKALAAEAGVAYIATEGNRFLKKYVGEGPEEVHRIFRTARKYAPAVLFIDEIDAIAKERRGGEGAEGSEATLTALLTEMDGFSKDPSKPVFVLAATNFDVEPGTPKSLDPALTRRFDRHLYIDLPHRGDRVKFLKMKREKNGALAVSDDLLENVAMRSTGMSLAELESMVEFALRSAIREGATKVTDEIFEEAFETFNNGETKKWDAAELECTARHEAGHAFLCWHGGETPSYLTVVARGKHGGYMQHANRESKGSYTREELLALIRTSLGGRAAELVYYGREKGVSTGASSDLANATGIAKSILCTYGMDDAFGLAVISPEELQGPLGQAVREGVNRILAAEMEKAIGILTENRERVDRLVAELLNKNHLTGKEIEEVLR